MKTQLRFVNYTSPRSTMKNRSSVDQTVQRSHKSSKKNQQKFSKLVAWKCINIHNRKLLDFGYHLFRPYGPSQPSGRIENPDAKRFNKPFICSVPSGNLSSFVSHTSCPTRRRVFRSESIENPRRKDYPIESDASCCDFDALNPRYQAPLIRW